MQGEASLQERRAHREKLMDACAPQVSLPVFIACAIALLAAVALACARHPTFNDYRRTLNDAAGHSARDCGVVELGSPPASALACARRSLEQRTPFFVIFGVQGIDSSIYHGLALDSAGKATWAQWDSDGSGGRRGPLTLPWIDQRSCTTPQVTNAAPFVRCSP